MNAAQIERLPTELLESIFMQCLNGGLLLASPRIASKLSGNESLYQTVYAVAFYNHQLLDVLDHLDIGFRAQSLPTAVTAWAIRSLTKAILRGRWCTRKWAVRFSQSLLDSAMDRLSKSGVHTRGISRLLEIWEQGDSRGKLRDEIGERPRYREGPTGYALLSFSHPAHIQLSVTADGYDTFYADDTDDNNIVIQFEFTMSLCGAAPEREESFPASNYWERPRLLDRDLSNQFDHGMDEPLSFFLQEAILLSMMDTSQATAVVPSLRSLYHTPLDDEYLYDSMRWRSWFHRFRRSVAIDYLLSSESAPYSIPPSAFVRAAHFDMCDVMSYRMTDYVPVYIHVLFEIDPTSLPRHDPIILQWASQVCERLRNFRRVYQRNRINHRQGREGEKVLLIDETLSGQRERRWQILAQYTFGVEVRMLRYIKTGEPPCLGVNDSENTGPAPPHLHDPIAVVERALGPWLDIAGPDEPDEDDFQDFHDDPDEIAAQYHAREEAHALHQRDGPNPPELDFLDAADFRRDAVRDLITPEEAERVAARKEYTRPLVTDYSGVCKVAQRTRPFWRFTCDDPSSPAALVADMDWCLLRSQIRDVTSWPERLKKWREQQQNEAHVA